MHGTPSSTLEVLKSAQLPFFDACDGHQFLKNGRLTRVRDFWGDVEKLRGRLGGTRGDRSVFDFLESRKALDPRLRAIFSAFVEGFHAADLSIMSERGLARSEQSDEDEIQGASQFRLPYGYDRVMENLAESLRDERASVRFDTIVKKVEWGGKGVTVRCRSAKSSRSSVFRAKKIVVTVPVGVLRAPATAEAAIEWEPLPKELARGLEALRMGDVYRLVLGFRERFWEKLGEEPVGFLHAGPEKYFPTWWTQMPLHTPYMVAWQGGPKATEMSHWSKARRLDTALRTLAELTRRPLSYLSSQLVSYDFHDWVNDPFSLGAYSYVAVGGLAKVSSLRKPIGGRIYFAGEAVADGAERGTVSGALDSGRKSAKAILTTRV